MKKPIDHVVLPVSDLAAARDRLGALGFTVAPDARHPFGTENACVFLRDGAYLEPLAVGEREVCEAAARAGNVFVARDQAYRFRCGSDGFSAVVMGTGDAAADDAAFRAAGISAGDILEFSRRFETPDGKAGEASFRLAFAADLRSPDSFMFTCQRINVPKVDRSALERHANTAVALREVVAVEENPSDFQYFVQDVVGTREVEAHSFGMRIEAVNGTLNLLTPTGFEAFFGIALPSRERGVTFEALVFAVTDLDAVKACLDAAGIPFRAHGPRIVVDRSRGQGAVFAFEEVEDR